MDLANRIPEWSEILTWENAGIAVLVLGGCLLFGYLMEVYCKWRDGFEQPWWNF